MSLKFQHLNIEGTLHIERVAGFLSQHDFDVVCFQEAPEKFITEHIKKLGYNHHFFVPMGKWDRFDDVIGLAIVSKYPFISTSQNILSTADVTYQEDVRPVFSLAEACVDINGSYYNFLTTHLPVNYPGHVLSEFQLTTYKKLKDILATKKSFILTGDFNCPRGVFIFDDLAKNYRDNVPVGITSTIDPVLHRNAPLELVVDGVFTTPDYIVSEVGVLEGLSDHKGIMGSLTIN